MRSRRWSILTVAVLVLLVGALAEAKPPPKTNPQQFEIYDETQDGLQVGLDPDIGNISAVANPGGSERLIIQAHIQGAAPLCELTVELVRGDQADNGGLSSAGHSGSIQVIGTLTTNLVGNGNAHFDIAPSGDGSADTQVYGHLDFENPSCLEEDGTNVQNNEYGAAPDPLLNTPFTWWE